MPQPSLKPPADTAAAGTVEVTAPQIEQSGELAANAIAVLLFVDEDGNGIMGENETNLIGLPVSLQDESGTTVQTQESGDAGVLFSELEAGDYQLTVEDTLGYTLASEATANVTVDAEGTEGTIIYIPVAAD